MRSHATITILSAPIKLRAWLTSRLGVEAIIFLILLALITLIWLPRFRGPIDLRWDGGAYYVLGTAIADGKGYKLLNEPGDIAATQYPPLLPAIIAAHQWVLGTSDPHIVGRFLRVSFFLVFAAYILAIYIMSRLFLRLPYAFLATAVSLLNFHTYFLSDLCFPEIPFALTTTLFVIFNLNHGRKFAPLLATIFALASYTLRTIGISLLMAWVAESLFNKEFKKGLIRLILACIPIITWYAYIVSVESSQTYHHPVYLYQRADYLFYNVSYARNISLKDPFTPELGYLSPLDILKRFLKTFFLLPFSLGEAVGIKKALWELGWEWLSNRLPFARVTPWFVYCPLGIIGGLILAGISLQLARRQWIIPLYILFYLGGLCLTPWPEQFPRYLAPLSPFITLSLFLTVCTIKGHLRKLLSSRRTISYAILSLSIVFAIIIQECVISFLAYTKRHQAVIYNDRNGHKVMYRLFFYGDAYRAFDTALDWLKQHAMSTDVVASSMPHWVYLRTGLKSVMPPFETNYEKAHDLLDSVPVNYLILDHGLALDTKKYALLVVKNAQDRWKLVYTDVIISNSIIPYGGREPETRFEIYQRIDSRVPFSQNRRTGAPDQ